MADAYISSPLLEQNRFLLRIDDEGVAQAVAQLRPTLSFVASTNRDLVADTTTGTGQPRGGMGALCRQQPQAGDRGSARDGAGRAAGPRVGRTAGAAGRGHRLSERVARPAGGQRARGQRPRRDAAAARRARPLRGRRGHPHRRRPGRGAAGAGALRPGRRAWSAPDQPGAFRARRRAPPRVPVRSRRAPGLPRSEAEADGLARQNAPSILRLQHEVRSDDLALEGARASYRPTITLDGSATNTFQAPNPAARGRARRSA
jgi:outer membrane protein